MTLPTRGCQLAAQGSLARHTCWRSSHVQSTVSCATAAAMTQWGLLEQTTLRWLNPFKLLTDVVFSLLRNQAAYWLSYLGDVIPLNESWGQWNIGSDHPVTPCTAGQRVRADHWLQFIADNRKKQFTSNHTVYKLQCSRKVLISHTKVKWPWRRHMNLSLLIFQKKTTS